MQITVHPTPGLTATEAAERDQRMRQWLLRIYQLMQATNCELATAIRAIEAADRESDRNN